MLRAYTPSGALLRVVTVLLTVFVCPSARGAEQTRAALVTDRRPGPAARHGLDKLTQALQEKGFAVDRLSSARAAGQDPLIIAGLAGGQGPAARMLRRLDTAAPTEPESLLIRRLDSRTRDRLLVCAADDRGLMYALLDVADRIGWARDAAKPLSEVRDAFEKPAVPERALSVYTFHQATFEQRFFDESYWAEYLDMLARNRFNTFALLFGYENWGYFSPPYPYFFDLEQFGDVRVVGITRQKQQKNLRALKRLIEMTHQRGLNFTLGIWDHIYRGGVQGPKDRAGKPTEGIVWGLNSENLTAYTAAALTRFLELVPEIDAIQFRMHGESGLKRTEMGSFWENVYRVVKEHAPEVRFDARAKNFPDSLIDKALDMGLNMRICTKYWMEQMGLPFHPTHIHPGNQHDRRHGYADLLRYPKRYQMHWRLWNCGTTRVLLWGDPDYVRRFAQSTHLYDGQGFEVVEPMATKMQDHPHDAQPFELLNPKYRYYRWEFERYWHFYQVFGRVGYNPDAPAELWRHEFQRRFGGEAGPYVEQALHKASKILPRIVAYNYPYNMFPTTRGWVEKQRMKALPEYARALPSDTQQFLSIDQAARYIIEGKYSAKFTPAESSRWFAAISEQVLELVRQAERKIGAHSNNEFISTVTDLKILAHLARYHSERAMAGLSYALFKHSGDVSCLDDAIEREGRAVAAWEKLVASAADVYNDDLAMGRPGAGLSGHWRDELAALRAGLEKLREQRRKFHLGWVGEAPVIKHVPVRKARPGQNLLIKASAAAKTGLDAVRIAYRTGNGERHAITMARTSPLVYSGSIPGANVEKPLSYNIEATDKNGRTTTIGPFEPLITTDDTAPTVVHRHITTAPVGKPLKITATVTDPAQVKQLRLRYRNVTQFEDYKSLDMTPGDNGSYSATVPGDQIGPKYDFMYLIEVMDNNGNGAIYPDMETETPYVIVRLQR